MKKKAKKKIQKTKSQFRKRRNMTPVYFYIAIDEKDYKFFEFIAKASREGRL